MAKMTKLTSGSVDFEVYEVEPARSPRGGLIVIHEVWGLDEHIRDVARRFASEGYYVLAPDLLGGTGMDVETASKLKLDLFNPEKRTAVQPKLRQLMAPLQAPDFGQKTLDKLQVCFDYLYSKKEAGQKVAVTGFCFGGSYSFSLAVAEPRLKAAAPFYGHADFTTQELSKIKCPIMAFYGQEDHGLVDDLPELKHKMSNAGVEFKAEVYPGTGHAFFNDTNKYSHDQAAASDAWDKVRDFLAVNLS